MDWDCEYRPITIINTGSHISKKLTEQIESVVHVKGSMTVEEDGNIYDTYTLEELFEHLPHTVTFKDKETDMYVNVYIHKIDHYYGTVSYEATNGVTALFYTGDIGSEIEKLMTAIGRAIVDINTRRNENDGWNIQPTVEEFDNIF